MIFSGARAIVAGGTECGGHIRAARIVDGTGTRDPIRRNGQRLHTVLGHVGGERRTNDAVERTFATVRKGSIPV